MASRYIARRYGETSESRSRASSSVRESSSRATSQVGISSPKATISFLFCRFATTYHFTPEELQLPNLAAPPLHQTEPGPADHLTTHLPTLT